MKTTDTIRRAGRSLRQAKARTLLTSLAIAVGAFTLTLALAVGEGSRQYVDKIISSNVDEQMLYVAKDKTLFGEGATMGGMGGLREYSESQATYAGMTLESLNAEDIKKIQDNSDVVKVTPQYLVTAQYVEFSAKPDKKYTTDITLYDTSVLPDVAAGTLPERGAQIGDDEIIVPEAYLSTMDIQDTKDFVGSEVTLRLMKMPNELKEDEITALFVEQGQAGVEAAMKPETREVTYKVRAVSQNSATSMSASQGLFISENQARELSEWLTSGTEQEGQYIAATAQIAEGVDPASVKAALEKDEIYSMTAEDLQEFIFRIVNLIQAIVIGFSVLALIASIFGIINTMYISVLERTQQIGLMKSLGMSGREVARLFRYEAAWIGALGGVIGAALAVLLGLVANPYITEATGMGEGNSLLVFQPHVIAILIAALTFIAVVAGYFPARKAAKLDPIEALRTE